MLDEFESYAAQLQFAAPTLPLVCNRTGAVLTAQTPIDARYWRRHSRQPVQFAESVRTVAALGCSVLMEIGPQPVLTGAAVQVWPEHLAAPRAIVSMRKGVSDRRQIADALAAAYVGGHRPDFAALHGQAGRRLELPTYPFQRRRFWPKTSGIVGEGSGGPAVSGILGSAKDLASGDSVYTSRLSVKSQPWLSDHVIYGTVVVPGATYAAMALAAVGPPARVKEVFFYEPIILPEKSSREVQLTLHPLDRDGEWSFQVHSRPYGERDVEWSLNADGTVAHGVDDEPVSDKTDPDIDETHRATGPHASAGSVRDLRRHGAGMGADLVRSLKSLWLGEGEAIGDILVGEELAEQLGAEPMHPVLMDLCTGVAFPAFPALLAAEQGVSDLFLPLRYGQVSCWRRCRGGSIAVRGGMPAPSTAKPRSSISISSIGMAGTWAGFASSRSNARLGRRCCAGSAATPPGCSTPWAGMRCRRHRDDDAANVSGTWLIAGFDELADKVPGCIPLDRDTDPELLGQVLAAGARARSAVLRCGLAQLRRRTPMSRAPMSRCGWRPRSPTCSVPCTPCRAAPKAAA